MDVPPTFVLAHFASGMHWIIILVIALLLFGRRLPTLLRDVGGSIRQFRKGMEDGPQNLDAPEAKPKPGATPAVAERPDSTTSRS
jgi:TatA/E family protein of Tat protein translocase